MADEKLSKGPEGEKLPEPPAPDGPGTPPAPEQVEQVTLPGMGEDGPAPADKVINLADVRMDGDKGGKAPAAPACETEKPGKRKGPPAEGTGRARSLPNRKRRPSPAQAAHPRGTRRPAPRPSRPRETKCPKVKRKPRKRAPAGWARPSLRQRARPGPSKLRRPLSRRSTCRLHQPSRPARLRRARLSI